MGLPISELSVPQRIGDLKRKQGSGRGFLVPLAVSRSRTHLSLRKSGQETLESDIHPPFASPPPSLHFRDAMHDGHCHSASRVTSLSLSLQASLFFCLGENINAVAVWQIYIQHLHPSMKSINYGPLAGRKATQVVREKIEKMKPQRILLIRDEGDGVESDNMQRDETMCVLDVGMKKGEGRNQRLQPAVGSRA